MAGTVSTTPSLESFGHTRHRRKRLVLAGALTVLIVGVGAAGFILVQADDGPDTDDYIGALEDEGVDDEFRSDRAAVRAAERLCEDIDAGDVDPVGPPQDRIAVEYFCPEFLSEFEELATTLVEGTFTLYDSDEFLFDSPGDPCSGSGGYSDIGPGAQVQVKDETGTVLAAVSLGTGEADGIGACEFTFEVELTEGSDQYLFEVGSRGQIAYTWEDLTTTGAHLSLG